jgi:tRNA pseudouridine13 synthase
MMEEMDNGQGKPEAGAAQGGGLAFLSKAPGTGGTLKAEPEDFLVEEIMQDGTVLGLGERVERGGVPGKFVHFVLQKRNWATSMAMMEIARRLHIGRKAIGFAGSKDKCAVTTQLASIFGVRKEDVLALGIRDIAINGAWTAREKVRLGALAGNRFTIRVRGASEDADGRVRTIAEELGGMFPNYFGEQRFGSSARNTHRIGELLIRGKNEDAAMAFLCGDGREKDGEARLAREDLKGKGDFASALKAFPRRLRLERMMLAHLSERPDDFIGAFRSLPRQTLLLFVHAFQSHLFNLLLSERMREGGVEMEEGEYLCPVSGSGFPETERMDVDGWLCIKIIGYDSNPNVRERALLDSLGIRKDDFRMRGLPEVASRGTFRTAFAPMAGFSFDPASSTFRFSLQSGSYATAALREFLEVDKA